MANIVDTFRKRVRERLEYLDLTQTALAERLGEATPSVAQYIGPSAAKAPGLEKLAAYAKALECRPSDLIDDAREFSDEEISKKAFELISRPERLAVLSVILSLDEEKLSVVRDVVGRFSRPNKKKSTATG